MSISKTHLSGSTGGRQIKVAATTTPGTTIHTTGTSSTTVDEVWLFATNQDATAIVLTVEFGGTTDPDDRISLTIPAKSGDTLVCAGRILSGDGSAGRVIKAFASTANKVMLGGHVNRIS